MEPAEQAETGTRNAPRVTKTVYELALIIVGVLIALAVDEWREHQDFAARSASALGQVRIELARNAELVTIAAPRHAAVAGAYQQALEKLQTEKRFERPQGELGNVEMTALTRSAFEALLLSGVATTLEPTSLALIAQAYDSDQQYRDLSGRYMSSVLATDFMDGERYFQQMWFWAEALSIEEKRLAAQHQAAIAVVDAELAGN